MMISKVVIDPHYKVKHHELNDALILELVKKLDFLVIDVEKKDEEFHYLKFEPVFHEYLPYRLVFVLCEKELFLGVINAFRIKRKKVEKL